MKTFEHKEYGPYEEGDKIKLKSTSPNAPVPGAIAGFCTFIKYSVPCSNYNARHINCKACTTHHNGLIVRGDLQSWESCSTNSYGEPRWRIVK